MVSAIAVPGLLTAILLCVTVRLIGRFKPGTIPPGGGEKVPMKEKLKTLTLLVPIICLFGLIIGSLVSMFMNSSIYPVYLDATHPLWDYIVGGCLLVGGAILTFILYKFSNKKEN